MSAPARPGLRERVDALLDSFIKDFYETVPYAQHQRSASEIDLDYYKRHNIETILRLRRKRTIDALAIKYFTKHDPVQAKAWAHYTDDEMLHDRLFAADLAKVGVAKDEIYATEPLLSTKLLTGYLQYGMEFEDSPLALITSVYFVEYTTTRTQPEWLDNLEKVLGRDEVKGQRAHVNTDLDDDHDDFVWRVLTSLVSSEEDERRVVRHLHDIYWLWKLYFTELHQRTVLGRSGEEIAPPAPAPAATDG
ncbi:iron-containing redox enzyme family protein [Streptomyces sp. NPDC046261]|uniref:iron-containing redox enzyme family protein n=1 Tax=Streptomyces sp. NPDC046261 TaxID=3157200 RepID=UPI0033F3C77E